MESRAASDVSCNQVVKNQEVSVSSFANKMKRKWKLVHEGAVWTRTMWWARRRLASLLRQKQCSLEASFFCEGLTVCVCCRRSVRKQFELCMSSRHIASTLRVWLSWKSQSECVEVSVGFPQGYTNKISGVFQRCFSLDRNAESPDRNECPLGSRVRDASAFESCRTLPRTRNFLCVGEG